MKQLEINFDLLFDAEAYRESGYCPWTFFAYPTSLADKRGLPPDEEACTLLANLQAHGIEVAIWVNGYNETTYLACRKNDMQILHETLQTFEETGMIEKNFLQVHSDLIFAKLS
jgi:hypothetical protein